MLIYIVLKQNKIKIIFTTCLICLWKALWAVAYLYCGRE